MNAGRLVGSFLEPKATGPGGTAGEFGPLAPQTWVPPALRRFWEGSGQISRAPT